MSVPIPGDIDYKHTHSYTFFHHPPTHPSLLLSIHPPIHPPLYPSISALTAPATLNGDVINKAQFEALQHAMKQLEGKFSQAMRDKADLADQKENLEHIILQLQGETETIGMYRGRQRQ